MRSCNNKRMRRKNGAALVEFSAATTIFFCAILIPLVNMGFVPVRYMFCETILSNLAVKLAHCEKLSDAYTTLADDSSWKSSLHKFGVDVSGEEITMLATTSDGEQKFSLRQGQRWPQEWLPSGPKGPFVYSLNVHCQCSVNPFFGGTSLPAIAGITGPINFTVSGGSQWENLSRDPKSPTLSFFIEE